VSAIDSFEYLQHDELQQLEVVYSVSTSVDDDLTSMLYTAVIIDQSIYEKESWGVMVGAAMCNLYGNRVKFTKRSALLQLLCDAGFSRRVLLDMVDRSTTGIPPGITRMAINRFFMDVGPGPLQDVATITKHFNAEKARDLDPAMKIPGKLYQFDAFELPFSKVADNKANGRLVTVSSFNGHKVVAIAVDVVTMSATLVSAVSWKQPHHTLISLIAQLKLQGHEPVEITADKQFVTPECNAAVRPCVLRQSVPGAHDIWTPDVEGAIR
jgi:hypothetical protein